MSKALLPIIDGELLDECLQLNLQEVSRYCAVETTVIITMVQEGVIEPHGHAPDDWRFPGPELVRLKRALRLQHDLGLNLPGLALALELLDEVEELRARLASLER